MLLDLTASNIPLYLKSIAVDDVRPKASLIVSLAVTLINIVVPSLKPKNKLVI